MPLAEHHAFCHPDFIGDIQLLYQSQPLNNLMSKGVVDAGAKRDLIPIMIATIAAMMIPQLIMRSFMLSSPQCWQ